MAGKKIAAALMEKLKLILSAVILMAGIVFFLFILDNYGVTDQWQFYVMGCLIYSFGTLYLVVSMKIIRVNRTKLYALLATVMLIPICTSCFLFCHSLITLPSNLAAYLFANMILVPATVMIFEYLTRITKLKLSGTSK